MFNPWGPQLLPVQKSVPKLTPDLHKGQCGRIEVIGGAQCYSGAPCYVALASLRLGADLLHVFRSPDIILHGTLVSTSPRETVEWFPRLHAIAVGPGLGREESVFKRTVELVQEAIKMEKLLIFDADSIDLISRNKQL